MGFRMSSGGSTVAGSAVITGFNATTKVLTVVVRDQFGALVGNGIAVDVYVDGGGSPYASGTTAGGAGVATITLTGLDTAVGHSIVPKATLSVVYTGTGLAYAPAFGIASFTGTQAVRKTSGGLNPTADNATATLTVSGGVITGVGANTAGANYEPGTWQTVTAGGAPTVAFRGQVQALSTGALDWTTLSFTGTGHDGVALNAGTGYSGSSATGIITRKCSSFIIACRIRTNGTPVSGEFLFNSSNNYLQSQLLTGFKLRTDLSNGTIQYRGLDTGNLSATDLQDHIVAIDLKQAYNAGTNPGQQVYLNNANVGPTHSSTTTYNPVVDGTTAGLVDVSTTLMTAMTIGAALAGSSGFAHVDIEYVYMAWGLPARDSVTNQLPAFGTQLVRDRFLPGNINMTNGTGVTNRAPQIFFTGDSLKTGTNLGTGGDFGTIVGTF